MIYLQDHYDTFEIINCVFDMNTGDQGVAIYLYDLFGGSIINSTFSNNLATSQGGALYYTFFEGY